MVLPSEIMLAVFLTLDRHTLDAIQLVCHRFSELVASATNGFCLRLISEVELGSDFYEQQTRKLLIEAEFAQRSLDDTHALFPRPSPFDR